MNDEAVKSNLKREAKERSRSKSLSKSENKKDTQTDLKKFFSNYALELYGSSILEKVEENSLGLKTIFDKIFENQFLKYDIDLKFEEMLSKNNKKMSSELNESLTDEIEQLQLQLNSLRS